MTANADVVTTPPEAGSHRGHFFALVVAGSLSVLLGLSAVWKSEGWPHNHEGVSWVDRVRVYAGTISQGDPLPVWSREGAAGLGEAMPLFYHELFNLVADVCYLAVGSYKTSRCLALFLFGSIGVLGLYKTCRQFGLGPWPALAVGATFPHLDYAVTDWLVRRASFLQFPRRFLCFLSPLLVCIFVGLSRKLASVDPRLATGVVVLVRFGTIGLNAGRSISYPFFPRTQVENPQPTTWREYWPVRHAGRVRVGLDQAEIAEYATRGAEAVEGAGCRITEVESGRCMERVFEVQCPAPCVVAVPVAYSGMEAITAEFEGGRERVVPYRTGEDPRVRIVAPAGRYRLRLGLPTASRALRAILGS